MTELLTHDRLQQLARPIQPSPRMVLRLQWTIDAETGRPTGCWVLSPEPCTQHPAFDR